MVLYSLYSIYYYKNTHIFTFLLQSIVFNHHNKITISFYVKITENKDQKGKLHFIENNLFKNIFGTEGIKNKRHSHINNTQYINMDKIINRL